MRPSQMKCARGDMQQHRCAGRVCKKTRFARAKENTKPKQKSSEAECSQGVSPKATSSTSRFFKDDLTNQTRPPNRRLWEGYSSTSHNPLSGDGSSDSSPKRKPEGKVDGEIPDRHASLSMLNLDHTPPLNLNAMPAEVLQMIWAEVIKMPACHTFKVKKGDVSEEGSRWSVHLMPGNFQEKLDPSAYQLWKQLLRLKNIGVQMAFRHIVKQIQPVALRLPKSSGSKAMAGSFYKTMAAIDKEQDLVILELDRRDSLPWFEHTNHRYGMNWQLIQNRMSHFRRVAIHYKDSLPDCSMGGAFACLCHGANQPHDHYKTCPLTLASFLDLLPNLERFYFVVERKRAAHRAFAASYKKKIAESGFQAQIDFPGGPETRGKQFTLPRFFDTTFEYIQQAPLAYLEAWRMESPWAGEQGAQKCLTETLRFYKSQIGNEPFRQKLEKRVKVRFGLLIPYPLEDKNAKVEN